MTRFEEQRRASGFTQRSLAAELGITDAAVRKWDNGNQPHPQYIPKLAKLLKLKPVEVVRLFAGEPVAA